MMWVGVDHGAGDDWTNVWLGTIPAGTLKVGEPLRLQDMVDAYIAATADEPGELDHLKAFQRVHLGEPFSAGGVHQGGVRLVGEREISWSKSPFLPQSEQVVVWPRRAGKATARQALEAARREQWRREHERDMKQPVSFVFDDLEGDSCD
jgi:hypothetical protein